MNMPARHDFSPAFRCDVQKLGRTLRAWQRRRINIPDGKVRAP
jgi:hypothetical protein